MTEPAAPIDLAAILEAGPPQRSAVLEISRIDFGAFGVGELLELSRAVGVEPEHLGRVMGGGRSSEMGRLAVGLAWIIARRREPDLTLEEVGTWSIEIRGSPQPKARRDRRHPTPPATPTSSRRRGPNGSSASQGPSASTPATPSG